MWLAATRVCGGGSLGVVGYSTRVCMADGGSWVAVVDVHVFGGASWMWLVPACVAVALGCDWAPTCLAVADGSNWRWLVPTWWWCSWMWLMPTCVARADVWWVPTRGGGKWRWLVSHVFTVAVGRCGSWRWLVPTCVVVLVGCGWCPRVWLWQLCVVGGPRVWR